LHESRLQSFGLPSSKNKTLISTQQVSTGFGWQILNDAGTAVLQQNNIDMLMVLPHKHSFLERLGSKTHTEELLGKITIPVVCIADYTD